MLNNKQKERLGMLTVEKTVTTKWFCDWQEYAQQNDEGIDGIIIMRKGQKQPIATGGVLFIQVKCGGNGYRSDQKQHPNHICINLGKEYIDSHKPRWNKVPGPAILIFADDNICSNNPPCWWVDLKKTESYSKSNQGQILIPKEQKWGAHSKGEFHKLCGPAQHDRILPFIKIDRLEDVALSLKKGGSIRDDAWNYYKQWRSEDNNRTNPKLGKIIINRVGWKHITRKGRKHERILQSWLLLGAAKKIIKSVDSANTLRCEEINTLPDGAKKITDYLGLKANISYSYRHETVVQVILKRVRFINPEKNKETTKIWFYSVYELRRGIFI